MGIWALYKLTAVVLIASQAVQGAGVCGTALQCPSGIEGALGFDVRALRRSLDSCSNCFENWVKLVCLTNCNTSSIPASMDHTGTVYVTITQRLCQRLYFSCESEDVLIHAGKAEVGSGWGGRVTFHSMFYVEDAQHGRSNAIMQASRRFCEDSLSHVGLRQHSPDGSSVLMRLRVLPDDVKATDQALDDATVALPAGQDFCVKYPSSVVADTLAALAVCATGMVLNHALRICGLDLLPEATMHMLLGICIGILAQHRAREGGANAGHAAEFRMNTELLNYFVLPPIVFEAGYSLSRKSFMHHFGSIVAHALVGTVITVIVVAGGLQAASALFCDGSSDDYAASSCGFLGPDFVRLEWFEALVFAALLCAVDPAATLQVFSRLGVKDAVGSLVTGENLLNDVVAFVLFTGFKAVVARRAAAPTSPQQAAGLAAAAGVGAELHTTLRSDTPAEIAGLFFAVTFKSVAIGLGVGILSALFFRVLRFTNVAAEVLLCLFFAFAAFLLAELPGVAGSGALSLLLCSMLMASFTRVNVSRPARFTLRGLSRTLSTFAELVLYIVTGMVMVTQSSAFSFSFTVVVLLLFVAGRALAVFPVFSVLNALDRCHGGAGAPRSHAIMLFMALSSPTIAIGLCFEMPSRHSYALASSTSFIVFVTTLCFGSSTPCAVRRLRLLAGESDAPRGRTGRLSSVQAVGRGVRVLLCRPESRTAEVESSQLEKEIMLGERQQRRRRSSITSGTNTHANAITNANGGGGALVSKSRVQV